MYKISTVNPGDLITAAYVDSLVLAILDLNNRVTKLESGGAVSTGIAIYSASPNPVMVNSTLTVIGANFSVPTGQNTVTLGGQAITGFKDLGSANQFAFTVPSIANLDPSGTPLALSVTNAQGQSASIMVTVQPFVQAPAGRVVGTTPQPSITGTAASPMTIGYPITVTGQVSTDAAYSATLTCSNSSFQAVFLSDPNNPSSSLGSTLPFNLSANASGSVAAGSQTLNMQVIVPSGLANGVSTDVTLLVTCTTPNNQVQPLRTFVVQALTIGNAIPVQATGINVTLSGPMTTSGTISYARPTAGQTTNKNIIFSVAQTLTGATTGSVAMSPSTGWSTTGATQNIPVGSGPGNWSLDTPWAASSTAVNATLMVTITAASGATFKYAQPITVTG